MKKVKKSRISLKLSLRVFLICSIFGLIGSTLIYLSQQQEILDDQLKLLKEISSSYYREIDNEITRKMLTAQTANETLSKALSKRQIRSSWESHITRGANGEYRADDGLSGAFSSSETAMSPELIDSFNRTGEIWELLAPMMVNEFENFWFVSDDNFLRISPKALALEVPSDFLSGEYRGFDGAIPESNPRGIPFWSDVYYDSVKRTWTTSLIIPLYDNENFLGMTGSDLHLNRVLDYLNTIENRSYGFKFLIFDDKDNLLMHPGFSLNIPGKDAPLGELLNADNLKDRNLAEFITAFNKGEYRFSQLLEYREDGGAIKGFAYAFSLLNWRFVVYREVKDLRKPVLALGWKVFLFTMLIALGLAFMIRLSTGRLIIKRIRNLVIAVKQYKEKRDFILTDNENDELSLLSETFKQMSQRINSQFSNLYQTNSELKGILEASTLIFIISTDIEGTIREYNKGAENILGYSRKEMVGINTPAKFHNAEQMIERGQELTSIYGERISGFSVFTHIPMIEGYEDREWLCTRKDGQEINIHLGVTPIHSKEGKLTGFLGMGMDITKRKHQERELLELREYLVSILNSISSPILAINGDLTVVQWNSSAITQLGEGRKSFKNCEVFQILKDFSDDLHLIVKSIEEHTFQCHYRKKIIKEGRTSYWNLLIYPLRSIDRVGAVIHIEDITDSIHMEEMMIQSEKMLSVGGLAAGMAHEINNPLAGIMQTLEVMNRRLVAIDQIEANRKAAEETGLSAKSLSDYMEKRAIYSMVEKMRDSGRRIASIVENMLSFARKSEGSYNYYNLEDLITSTIDLAMTDYDLQKNYDFRNIKIDLKCTSHTPPVPCEKNKIQQVLLNILQNGAHAMTAADINDPSFTIECRLRKEKQMVYIEITDNGPGMSEEVRKRVFEPFFTTKEEGVGTGLGLSVSYFIITENHQGEMAVESSPGKGTRFVIGLPMS